jgi:hypothetical protein
VLYVVDEGKEIDTEFQEASRSISNPRTAEIAKDAIFRMLNDLRENRSSPTLGDVLESYIRALFEIDYTGKLQNVSSHHLDVSHEEIERRMRSIMPLMDNYFSSFSRQLARGADVSNLRMPDSDKPGTQAVLRSLDLRGRVGSHQEGNERVNTADITDEKR